MHSRLAELAFHFVHSGDRRRGATYSRQAAEQAMQSFAFEEAMSHYRKLLNSMIQMVESAVICFMG